MKKDITRLIRYVPLTVLNHAGDVRIYTFDQAFPRDGIEIDGLIYFVVRPLRGRKHDRQIDRVTPVAIHICPLLGHQLSDLNLLET